MKVLMMLYDLGGALSGMEKQALALAERLRHEGVDVGFLTRAAPGGPTSFGGPFHVIPRLGLPGLRCLSWMTSLAVHLPGLLAGVDVLHIHQASLAAGIARPVAHRVGCKTLVKVAGSGRHGELRALGRGFVGTRLLRSVLRADCLVALTQDCRDDLRAEGVPDDRIAVVPNGVDTERFKPSPDPDALARRLGLVGDVRFAYLGRLATPKGVHTMLDAWESLASRAPGCHLYLAGDGPERERLLARTEHSNLKGRVHLLGEVSNQTAFLGACHALLLPSESEGMSNALLEAMAVGLPAVVTDIPANRELCDPSCARLVAFGDAGRLANAVLELAAAPLLRAQLGAEARARALERFSFQAVVKTYLRLYQGLRATR